MVGAPEEGAGCVRGAPDGAPWGARSERVEVEVAVRSEHQAARLAYGWGLVVVGGPEGLDKEAYTRLRRGLIPLVGGALVQCWHWVASTFVSCRWA